MSLDLCELLLPGVKPWGQGTVFLQENIGQDTKAVQLPWEGNRMYTEISEVLSSRSVQA